MRTKLFEAGGLVLVVAGVAGYDWRLASIVAGAAAVKIGWTLDGDA